MIYLCQLAGLDGPARQSIHLRSLADRLGVHPAALLITFCRGQPVVLVCMQSHQGLSYHDINEILENYLSHGQLQTPSPPEAPFPGSLSGSGQDDVFDNFAPPAGRTSWLDYEPGQVTSEEQRDRLQLGRSVMAENANRPCFSLATQRRPAGLCLWLA